MALKALLLKKKLDESRKALDALRAKDAEFEKREAELAQSIEEVTEETTAEEREALDGMVTEFEGDKAAHEEEKGNLERVVSDLENELAAEEAAQNTEPPKEKEERKMEDKNMNTRFKLFEKMTAQERSDFVSRDDVKSYLAEVRSAIREKRALNNVGLTIPEVMLGLLRENVINYSKLYRHVTVRSINGEGRMVVMGSVPEAIWTECCANLNELSIGFNDVSVDCYKVAGYFKICNATLEDSDLNLAAELMSVIGQAIGIAIDKAILYGRNSDDAQNMPMGIVTRLVQTSKPAGYPATARDWADLHTSNVKTISNATTGVALFQALMLNGSAAKGKYARGEKVWVMNETTYSFLKAQAMSVNAAGAIVSGFEGTMPVLGGVVEVLEFIPDYVIIGGYMELYLLAERRGQQFATSEHVRFLQDETVMKGTARYDGTPVIAEAFVAIGVNSTTPDATMNFGADEANSVMSIALNTSTASVVVSGKTQLFAITAPGSGPVTWTSATTGKATVDSNGVVTGVASGSSVITATANGKTASCTVTVTTE